jgi:hypothetical protein
MTFYIQKTDKSTSTFSNTRQIAESVFNQKTVHDRKNKETMTMQQEQKDASTATESIVTEGKMAECISRLRIVSDRLQSPTNKTPPDVPWRVPSPNPTDNAIGGNVTFYGYFTRGKILCYGSVLFSTMLIWNGCNASRCGVIQSSDAMDLMSLRIPSPPNVTNKKSAESISASDQPENKSGNKKSSGNVGFMASEDCSETAET